MLVGELETRMERLRALYDMYFMGIERIEPLVPKKDVLEAKAERRVPDLRAAKHVEATLYVFARNPRLEPLDAYEILLVEGAQPIHARLELFDERLDFRLLQRVTPPDDDGGPRKGR